MNSSHQPGLAQRMFSLAWRWFKRAALALGCLLLTYLLIVLIGLIPVNNDFAPAADGIEILLTSSAVHADLILPVSNDVIDWRNALPPESIAGDVRGMTHVAIGWGDAGFYLNTPTWGDLRFSTAANALLWPSETCLHVGFTRDEYIRPRAKPVRISPAQYAALVGFIEDSFELDAQGNKQQIPGAYGHVDAFYESVGHYHALNTCNSWIGEALRTAGIRAPLWTPLPKSVFLYLPD